MPRLGQAQRHRRDDVAAGAGALEQAVAVAEAARPQVQPDECAGVAVIGAHAFEALAQFHPVGADVLDWRCARGAGDQRQVFQPGHAVGDGAVDQRVPVLAGAGGDQPGIASLFRLVGGDFHQQHQRVQVAGQHHIAAAAQDHQWQAVGTRVGQCRGQVGFAAHMHCKARARVESECIVATQGIEFVEICHARKR
ncbi:hypothetical protein D9M72_455920 [compost metagenome]